MSTQGDGPPDAAAGGAGGAAAEASGAGGSTATPGEAVRLDHVTKRFGDFTAVDDLNLAIERGEFFSMLGPSGCGKTTTLRMIAGFEQPSEGHIVLDGKPVETVPPNKRNVNTVFQSYALFEHLDVEGNVAFGLKRRKVEKSEITRRVGEALELVQLGGRGASKSSELSGGQKQRVALARALVNRPAVLLLDEPLGALDLKLRKQMQVELKSIQREVGITFIYVTHDQEEAMTMSDRIAVMNRGRYEQLADPETLYERPATRFVAGFLGISNLLRGTVVEKSDRYAAVRLVDDALVRIPIAAVDGASSIEVGVRPEKIRMLTAEAAAPEGFNVLAGTVRDASYVGVSTQYVIETRSGGRITVYEQNVERTIHGSLYRPGEDVQLAWSPDHSFAVAPSVAEMAPED